MKHEFKVGDHAEWNSEGYVRGKDHEKGHVRHEVQDLHGSCSLFRKANVYPKSVKRRNWRAQRAEGQTL